MSSRTDASNLDGHRIRVGDAIPINPHRARPKRWSTRTGVTAISVFAAVLAACGGIWQAILTRDSLELTREQITAQGHIQKQQLESAQIESQRQALVTEEQLRLTRESLRAFQATAAASERSATLVEKSVKSSSQSAKDGQRAYMVNSTSTLSAQPAKGQPLIIRMEYRNVGQTPALNVNAGWRFQTVPVGMKPPKLELARPEYGNKSIGSDLAFSANSSVPDEMVVTLANGKAALEVVGFIVYRDIFGEGHGDQWCGLWLPGSPNLTLTFCSNELLGQDHFF